MSLKSNYNPSSTFMVRIWNHASFGLNKDIGNREKYPANIAEKAGNAILWTVGIIPAARVLAGARRARRRVGSNRCDSPRQHYTTRTGQQPSRRPWRLRSRFASFGPNGGALGCGNTAAT
mgnify:CR=1 FL=1